MATAQQVRCWIEQAEADLAAGAEPEGSETGPQECHRRYWLQQAYEKAIKAIALMKWTGEESDKEFLQFVMFEHSPMSRLEREKVTKPIHALSRELETFVRQLDQSDALLGIDAAAPRKDPAYVHYRYPFLHEGVFKAPRDYRDWDTHQGGRAKVRAAIRRLIQAAGAELKVFERRPG